ncbi:hypothetical protein [Segatella hominis]|uniref:TIGR04255 family protein n=1 Tax=Segatella hominis TaxID=2518605 RepID=A0A4Y8V4Y1_9BACT|nr:hypothetical protein [Segatella hominis]TFH76145.1 hypothetical protein EXN75_14720 [Segatella hominis]
MEKNIDKTVLNRKATLFVTPPSGIIDEQQVFEYTKAFSTMKLLPSINKGMSLKITPQGIVQEPVNTFEMKKIDDSFKITSGPDRIEIISSKKDESMGDFLVLVNQATSILQGLIKAPIVRLALFDSEAYFFDIAQIDKAYGLFVNGSEEKPIEWQMQKVLRGHLSEDNTIVINKVYTVSRNQIGINGSPAKDAILLSAEVNTPLGINVDVLKKSISIFWTKAADIINEYLDRSRTLILTV